MGKKEKTSAGAKLSMNWKEGVLEYVEESRANMNVSMSTFINELLELTCNPSRVRKRILEMIIAELINLDKAIALAGPMEKERLLKDKARYMLVGAYYNDGYQVHYQDENLTKTKISTGYIIHKKDWVVVNPEAAITATNAAVLECRHCVEYDIPHFIWLNDIPREKGYDSHVYAEVSRLCEEVWPDFKEKVLDKQVRLVEDPDNPGFYLNFEEFNASPTIGLFQPVYDDDERHLGMPVTEGFRLVKISFS